MLATPMAHECLLQWNGFQSFKSRDFFREDGKETSNDDNEPDDNEELAEEYASVTDEHMLEKTNIAVQSEISVKHLVMYDVCNLFEVAFESRLSLLKAEIRRGMCKHFEIPTSLRDSKSRLVKKLSQMVEDCSCMKESNYAM